MKYQLGTICFSYDLIPISARDSFVTIAAPTPFTELVQVWPAPTTEITVRVLLYEFSKVKIPVSLKI